jgi:hypothetical protein
MQSEINMSCLCAAAGLLARLFTRAPNTPSVATVGPSEPSQIETPKTKDDTKLVDTNAPSESHKNAKPKNTDDTKVQDQASKG